MWLPSQQGKQRKWTTRSAWKEVAFFLSQCSRQRRSLVLSFPSPGAGEIKKGKKNRNPANEVVNAACFCRSSVAANRDLRISIGPEFLDAWGPFLESPETFRAHFGLHNSLYIFKAKASRGTKLCINFNFYSLYSIWKDRLSRTSGSQFYE